MRLILRVLAATVTALLAAPAYAGEPPFKGPRIEALVGLDATELPGEDGPEVMAGLRGGTDLAIGQWRLGIEADVSRSHAKRVTTGAFVAGDRLDVRWGTDFYAGIRPARPLSRRVLAYGLAGGVMSSMAVDYSGDIDAVVKRPGGTELEKLRRPGTLVGFWVGGGLEFAIDRRAFVRSEYRYSNFHDGLYRQQAVVGLGLRL